MTSYISLLSKIEAFCNAHLQIKKYGGEFREQMPNFATKDEKYPVVFVTPTSDTEALNTNQFTVDIYCVDLIQADRANLNSIISDCQLILKDMYVYYTNDNDVEIDVVGTASMNPLNNQDLDYVAGWVMSITFEVASYGSCAIPMNPIRPIPSTSCENAIQIITDSNNNRLYTNDIPSGATETQVITDSEARLKDTASNLISSTFIPAQGSSGIIAPDALLHLKKENDGTITNLTLLSNSSTDYIVDNNDISVNGTLQFDIHATEALDIRLRDASNNVITPISVTDSGNHATIVLPSTLAPRSTATLMKTGQTVSYALEDDAATSSQGRATDFVTLDTAPLHNNGSATLNTTTNRFTDSLGGQTYTNKVVLDWSTWNGSTLLGYRISLSTTNQTWEAARVECVGLTFGGFSDWRVTNDNELNNICKRGGYVTTVLNYAPFSITADLNVWTSTTYPVNTLNAYFLGSTGNASISNLAKTVAACRYMPVRTCSLSTSNILS